MWEDLLRGHAGLVRGRASTDTTTQDATNAPETSKGERQTTSLNSELVNVPPLDANTGKIEQYHITEPCPATLVGLESARQGIRSMLNRIVAEVDDITKNPELAVDEKRTAPYMGPFLFKELLPVSVSVPATEFASTQPDVKRSESSDAVVSNLTDMASKGGGVVRF